MTELKGNMVKAVNIKACRILVFNSGQSDGSRSREKIGKNGTKITLEMIPNGV
jgi:hypothetical protein